MALRFLQANLIFKITTHVGNTVKKNNKETCMPGRTQLVFEIRVNSANLHLASVRDYDMISHKLRGERGRETPNSGSVKRDEQLLLLNL